MTRLLFDEKNIEFQFTHDGITAQVEGRVKNVTREELEQFFGLDHGEVGHVFEALIYNLMYSERVTVKNKCEVYDEDK